MTCFTLVGQMDSPFVRRVAITLTLHQQRYTLNPLSVYADFDALRRLHPLGTVPLLIDDAGHVHSDTAAICAWLDARATQPLPAGDALGLQAMGWANTLASKAGELYRVHSGLYGAASASRGVARIQQQLSAGVPLLVQWLRSTPALSSRPGHAEIAVVCGLRFVLMVVAATGVRLSLPPGFDATCEVALQTHEQHAVFNPCPMP
jgi:glutathione S-transferase